MASGFGLHSGDFYVLKDFLETSGFKLCIYKNLLPEKPNEFRPVKMSWAGLLSSARKEEGYSVIDYDIART